MSMKRFTLSVLVGLLVLSFTVSIVGGDFGAQSAVQAESQSFVSGGDITIPGIGTYTPLPDNYTSSGGVDVQITVAPQPISPNGNYTFNKTPKFYFTRNTSASQYRISVTDMVATPHVLVYTYSGAGTCGAMYCYLQPTTALKGLQYEGTSGGAYVWAVQAMVSGAWQVVSPDAGVLVLSNGFNSTFDVNTAKWQTLSGTWTRTSSGYYKTNGIYLNSSSIMQKEYLADGIVYEVRMKRKLDVDYANQLLFAGNPDPLVGSNMWSYAYYFQYANDGYWNVLKNVSGVTSVIVSPTYSQYINPYNWNTLTVWMNGGYVYFWINGIYLGYVIDSSLTSGYVGVGMYQSVNGTAPLMVDYAKLYYSAVWPLSIKTTSSGQPDPAYELKGTSATDAGNLNLLP